VLPFTSMPKLMETASPFSEDDRDDICTDAAAREEERSTRGRISTDPRGTMGHTRTHDQSTHNRHHNTVIRQTSTQKKFLAEAFFAPKRRILKRRRTCPVMP
jgi:hypothetical protein